MMNYKKKYLKYKVKYLNLKKLRGGSSGGMIPASEDGTITVSTMVGLETIANITQLQYTPGEFKFNPNEGTLNIVYRTHLDTECIIDTPRTMGQLLNLAKINFYQKDSNIPPAYEYLKDLLSICTQLFYEVEKELFRSSYHSTNSYDLDIILNKIKLLYNYEDAGLNQYGTAVLNRWGFVTRNYAVANQTGPEDRRFIGIIIDDAKLESFKYIIDIAKIHLTNFFETVSTLERPMGGRGRVSAVQFNYQSIVNYFKITLADFLKIGFLSKFFEIDEDVYRASMDWYNTVAVETVAREQARGWLWHVGISMDDKVRDLFKQNNMPGIPDWF